MRSTEPSVFLIAVGATFIAVLLHEGAHFLVTRLLEGYWPEFVFAGVRYSRPLDDAHVGWIFLAGPLMDIALTAGFSWWVWRRRDRLSVELVALAVGATLIFVVLGIAVLITGRPEADLVKLRGLSLGGHRPGAIEIYLVYFAALLIPYWKGISIYRRYAEPGLLRWSQFGFLLIGSTVGFGISLAIRELLVAFLVWSADRNYP